MYVLGRNSLSELEGVHPSLGAVAHRAIKITVQDFTVFEGLRSLETQEEYVRRGVSKTLNSRHLKQEDGYGHALDLVPWIAGRARWEWGPIYHIAAAMQRAAEELQVRIIWGGCWDRCLNDLGEGAEALEKAVREYTVRHPGPDFIDGPHYQIIL